jgi:hypothetical protein
MLMNTDRASIERNVARLASERTSLFSRSGHSFGLSNTDQGRLRVIERELDECFASLRKMRAARDVTRFAREDPVVRRAIRPRTDAVRAPTAN